MSKTLTVLLLIIVTWIVYICWFLLFKFPLGFLRLDKLLGFSFGLFILVLTLATIRILVRIIRGKTLCRRRNKDLDA